MLHFSEGVGRVRGGVGKFKTFMTTLVCICPREEGLLSKSLLFRYVLYGVCVCVCVRICVSLSGCLSLSAWLSLFFNTAKSRQEDPHLLCTRARPRKSVSPRVLSMSFISLSVCLSVCPSVCLSVCVCVCARGCVCLSLHVSPNKPLIPGN